MASWQFPPTQHPIARQNGIITEPWHLWFLRKLKPYIDDSIGDSSLEFAGDSGTGSIDLDSETFTIAGTANEIETTATGNQVTVGLPDDVTITNLTISGTLTGLITGTDNRVVRIDGTTGLQDSSVTIADTGDTTIAASGSTDIVLTVSTAKTDGLAAVDLTNDAQTWRVRTETDDTFIIRDVTQTTDVFLLDNVYWEASTGDYSFHNNTAATFPVMAIGTDAWTDFRAGSTEGDLELKATNVEMWMKSTFATLGNAQELGAIYFAATAQDANHDDVARIAFNVDETGTAGQRPGELHFYIKPDATVESSMVDMLAITADDVTVGGNFIIPVDGYIGTTSHTTAIQIDSNGDIKLTGDDIHIQDYTNFNTTTTSGALSISDVGDVSIKGDFDLDGNEKHIRFYDSGVKNVSIKCPATLTNTYTLYLPVDDGNVNEVLTTDGSGNLSWSAGGSGTPAGNDHEVQFNDNGSFGASSNLKHDGTDTTIAADTKLYFDG